MEATPVHDARAASDTCHACLCSIAIVIAIAVAVAVALAAAETYGASFASFGFGPPPGALQWQQPPDAATAGDSNGPLPGVAEGGGDDLLDDEDLLAGGVADMFSEHDDGDN